MAVDKDKNKQVLVTFPKDQLDQVETYWHDHSLKNRNEAIRILVQKGLEKEQSD